MGMEYKCGLTVQSMKVNGIIIKQKERGHFGMLKEMFMKESLKMTRQMGTARILILMGRGMKATGEMTCKKVMELKYGAMVLNTLVTIKRVRSMDMVFINGSMDLNMKEIGLTIRLKVSGYILGPTADNMKDIGKIIICTDKESTLGKMVENMMEII